MSPRLTARSIRYDWLQRLSGVDTLLNPDLGNGEYELPGIDTTYVVRHLAAEMAEDLVLQRPILSRWMAPSSASRVSDPTKRFHSPTEAEYVSTASSFDVIALPGDSFFPSKLDEGQEVAIGHAVHSYLAAIPSMRSLADNARMTVAERCISAYSVSGLLAPSVLVVAANRFCDWVASTFPGATWHVEVPVSGPRSDGGQWVGVVDLLLELPNGESSEGATHLITVEVHGCRTRKEAVRVAKTIAESPLVKTAIAGCL